MTWYALFRSGVAAHYIWSEETPSAASCGYDMRSYDAVQIERPPGGPWETIDADTGALLEDPALFASFAKALIDQTYEAYMAGSIAMPAKAAEHAAKLEEARRVLDGGEPGPFLTGEAEATGAVIADLAETISRAADDANASAALVAADRRAAVDAVRGAATVADMTVVLESYRSAYVAG